MSTVQFDNWFNEAGTRQFAPCTAWVNFDGTGTVAIRDSFNVDSITDNGVGDYTVNFSSTMANNNYVVIGSSTTSSTNARGGIFVGPLDPSSLADAYANGTYSTAAVRIGVAAASSDAQNAALVDSDLVSVAIFGGF